MDLVFLGYVIYIVLDVVLTVWVASTLSRYGRIYLGDVFGNDKVGGAMNQLLVVGFYLVNFGFAALWLHTGDRVTTPSDVVQLLATKLGTVLLVVGALHLLNLLIFSRIRRNVLLQESLRQATRPTPSDAIGR
ncbi:MAG TPA: hypothetical protein VGL06_20350 [Pseudonocardiaceae bacterium]|jgi:hypothetical protein